jgi:hypothetical protein
LGQPLSGLTWTSMEPRKFAVSYQARARKKNRGESCTPSFAT